MNSLWSVNEDYSVYSSSSPSCLLVFISCDLQLCPYHLLVLLYLPVSHLIIFIIKSERKWNIKRQYRVKEVQGIQKKKWDKDRQKWKRQEKTGRGKGKGFPICSFLLGGMHHYILVSDMDSDEEHPTIKDILNEHLQCAKQYTEN